MDRGDLDPWHHGQVGSPPAFRTGLGLAATFGLGACNSAGYTLTVGSDPPLVDAANQPSDATVGAQGGALAVTLAVDGGGPCGVPCVTLRAQATGGVPPYAYVWDPGIEADGGVAEACSTTATSYTVSVTDSSGHTGEVPTRGATVSATVSVAAPLPCGGDGGTIDPASVVYWANWQDVDGGNVYGTISPPSGDIQVTYSGELYGSQIDSGTDEFLPITTFTSTTVANPPPGPGIIKVAGLTSQVDMVTFSSPVTNPLVAIYSLGTSFVNTPVSLLFGAPCTVLSSGPSADVTVLFGDGTLALVDGGVSGIGSSGVVEIEGSYSAIQWINPSDTPYASYTGLTVGIRAQP
jgi:hypothetical protein